MFEDTKLKVFMAVAKSGSFTAAAREIGISQPAVSQNIAELEKGVGEPLFDRQRGAARLTDKGAAFKEYASRILHWYEAMDSVFSPSARISHPGKVRILADSYCSAYVAPRLATALRISSPDLKFIINPYAKNEGNGDFDIKLFTAPRPSEATLLNTATLCGTVQACTVTSSPSIIIEGIFPEGKKLAMWSPYYDMVSEDLKALTAITSESPMAVESAASASEELIGILPFHKGIEPSLRILPFPMPGLQMDIHLEPAPTFSTSELYEKMASLMESGII